LVDTIAELTSWDTGVVSTVELILLTNVLLLSGGASSDLRFTASTVRSDTSLVIHTSSTTSIAPFLVGVQWMSTSFVSNLAWDTSSDGSDSSQGFSSDTKGTHVIILGTLLEEGGHTVGSFFEVSGPSASDIVLVHSSNTTFTFDLDGRNLIVLGTGLKVVSVSPISNTVKDNFPSLEVTMLVQGSLTRSLSNLGGWSSSTDLVRSLSFGSWATSAHLVVPGLEATVLFQGFS
jgi:hypothetical protein